MNEKKLFESILNENADNSDMLKISLDYDKYDVYYDGVRTDDQRDIVGNELDGSETEKEFQRAVEDLDLDEDYNYSEYSTSAEDGPLESDFDGCKTGIFNCSVDELRNIIENYNIDPDDLVVTKDGDRIHDINSLVFDAN